MGLLDMVGVGKSAGNARERPPTASVPPRGAPRTLTVSVREERADGVVRRAVEYEGPPSGGLRGVIAYTFRGQVVPPPLASHDFALVAVLFLAMSKRLDIHVRGSVSRTLLAHLEEFQDAWCAWRPRAYGKIRITADRETESGPAGNGTAILAYSGGVDANFSLLRHARGGAGRQRQEIAAAAFINGLDIPAERTALFEEAVANARVTLAEFGLPLTVIESDWKQTACTDWAMEYFAGIASCLYQFAGLLSVGLVGNCVDYRDMAWPWGSNPVTNPLLDSGGFRMVTDGAGSTRCDKVAVIARHPWVRDRLRVCWWGPLHGTPGANCGRCEKCLRTKLAFLCHGIDPGPALPANHTLADIACIGLRIRTPIVELRQILATARRNRIRAPWVMALRLGILVAHLAIGIRAIYCPLKRALGGSDGVSRLAGLVGGAAAVVYLALLARPFALLVSRPFLEEAFYNLAFGRALADGGGMAGGGFHAAGLVSPLMSLLYAPAFAITRGDMATALRLGLLLEIMLFALAALAIGASLRQADRCKSRSMPALIAALVFCNYTLSMAFLDGLETALAVALVFATYAWYRHRRQADGALSMGQALVVGGLCGLGVMARVDAALFAVALALTHALPRRGSAAGVPRPWRVRLLESSALLAAAAVVSVAGWLGRTRLFGTPLASSGRPISFDEVRPMSTWIASLRVLSNQCLGVVHLPTRHDHLGTSNIAGLLLLLAVAGFLLAVPPLRTRARAAGVAWRRRWDLGELAPLWLFAALLVVAYTLFLRVPQLQSHYLLVPRILLLFVLASFGAAFLQTFARRRALLLGALAAWTLVSLLPHARDFSGVGGNVMLGPAEWIRQNGGPEARVGMFQSGTTGFLDPERVVNLDGNVESSAPQAVRAGALSGFLAARHVRYLIDRREYLAFAWRDTALARGAVRLATLDNELEVWRVDPEPGKPDRPLRANP